MFTTVFIGLSLVTVEAAGRTFPPLPVATVADGKHLGPRAQITGLVTYTKKEDDFDYHFRVADPNDTNKWVVCEIIPELSMEYPKVGQKVIVWGIVRHDGIHKWWELHPVIGWKVQ
jgi:hypothetical protein